MKRTQLVIFDCDGVLVDSEPIACRTFTEALREIGLEVTQEETFDKFVGYSMKHCMELVETMLGRSAPENFVAELQSRTFARFKAELKAMPGIEQALDELDKSEIPFCVASSGDHQKMRTTLGITGLLPRFEAKMFSVTQVARGKPAPDVYLFAAEQMAAEPSRCVVVEDTPPGVKAGVAAGMRVLGFCAHTPREKLETAGAHGVFDNMRRLAQVLLLLRV
ncbi:MAG: HAD family hydrolase [Steroidobacteraceae bacterium]